MSELQYCLDFSYLSIFNVCVGALELASAGVSINIFNYISKVFNIPLLSVTTSFVAEDISKHAIEDPSSGSFGLWLAQTFFIECYN